MDTKPSLLALTINILAATAKREQSGEMNHLVEPVMGTEVTLRREVREMVLILKLELVALTGSLRTNLYCDEVASLSTWQRSLTVLSITDQVPGMLFSTALTTLPVALGVNLKYVEFVVFDATVL